MATPSPQSLLIVGGGRGIGFEATKYLLSVTPSTVKIVIFSLDVVQELTGWASKELAGRLFVVVGDVTNADDRNKALQTCLDEARGINTLVYCAGIITPIDRIDNVDLAMVRKSYDVNVFGAMEMVRLFTRRKKAFQAWLGY